VAAGDDRLPLQSAFGSERLAGPFDIDGIKPLDQIPGRTELALTEILDVPMFTSACLRFSSAAFTS